MRRLQIMIDEDLDEELMVLSHQMHRSKAALIRQFVRERLKVLPPLEEDPLWEMCGAFPGESAPVDDVVYPRVGPT